MEYNFQYDTDLGKRSYISTFNSQNEMEALRLAPKLTKKNLDITGFSKLRVKPRRNQCNISLNKSQHCWASCWALLDIVGCRGGQTRATISNIFQVSPS